MPSEHCFIRRTELTYLEDNQDKQTGKSWILPKEPITPSLKQLAQIYNVGPEKIKTTSDK